MRVEGVVPILWPQREQNWEVDLLGAPQCMQNRVDAGVGTCDCDPADGTCAPAGNPAAGPGTAFPPTAAPS